MPTVTKSSDPGGTCPPAGSAASAVGSVAVLTPRVAALLFFSGLCALVYQVAWFREFRLVFGGSTAASAAVTAIFMGGLGLGNAWLGKRVDASRNPLGWFARLELGIALGAALTPWLGDLTATAYIALGGQMELGAAGATVGRLLLASGVLALPTFLMGGTLPAAARAVTTAEDSRRESVGVLYAVNALGAVAGALASTFVLLPALGTRTTLWSACALNLAVAWAAWRLSRRAVAVCDRPSGRTGRAGGARANPRSLRAAQAEALHAERPIPPELVYLCAAAVGFAFFVMELVWYRMLGPILGGTTYTFGLILSVALLGIGLGGASYKLVARRVAPTLRGFAFTCALEAVSVAIPFALGDRLAILALDLQGMGGGFAGRVAGWAIVAAITVLPPALIAGFQFPLLIALAGRADKDVGRQVGLTCAWNTLGAIVGSLAGGFGLLPLLTAPGTWIAIVVLLVVVALAALLIEVRRGGVRRGWVVPAGAAAIAAFCLWADGPTAVWRHSGIGAGRFQLPEGGPNDLRDWANAKRRHVLWQADGVEASIALVADDGLSFFVDGKSDGNAVGDAGTQIMLGVLPAMLHPSPRTGLVVGLGTGETPGWLAEVPGMERVDVVELEPAVDEMARRCAAVNHDVLRHPRVRRIYNDARELLMTTADRYDVIASEPSNPYRAGIANLFTREFYLSCRERLTETGLFVQWVQAYEIDRQTVRTIFATLDSVFDHVEVWQSKPEDMLLVCSPLPIGHSPNVLKERASREPYRSALAAGWQVLDVDGLFSRYVASPELVKKWAGEEQGRINSDDRNLVEYGFARTVGDRSAGFSIRRLREEAVRLGVHRPQIDQGGVDWNRVEGHRQVFYTLFDRDTTPPPNASSEQMARSEVLTRYWEADMKAAVEAWSAAAYEPIFPTETCLLALACAEAGDDRLDLLLDQLRPLQPLNADAIEAYRLWREGSTAAAATALEKAFIGLRSEPWGFPHVFEVLFGVAVDISRRDPAQARRLFEAMSEPFAVYAYEERRMTTAHQLAAPLGRPAVVQTLEAFEPHVPWNEAFLGRRLAVYDAVGHPLAAQARIDLETYQRCQRSPDVLPASSDFGLSGSR